MPCSVSRASAVMLFVAAGSAMAQQYDPGASATEIKLGQTVQFSGPVSVAGAAGYASLAYFGAVNKAGGINGRHVRLIVLDHGCSPPKTVEATRRLVDDDNVAGYAQEGRAMARYVLETVASPKIAILYQDDDLGKDFHGGFRSGLGDKADSLIVSAQTFEVSDPTIDRQLIAAKVSGANVFYFAGTQKAGAEQVRGVPKLGWSPLDLVCSIAASAEGVLKPGGLENAEGLISTAYAKDPFDPAWTDDADVKAFLDWEKPNLTQGNLRDSGVVVGYIASFLAACVLESAGSTLTRENVLKFATHLDHLRAPMLLPGITATTSPTDYSVINRFQIQRFEKGRWVGIGKTMSGE